MRMAPKAFNGAAHMCVLLPEPIGYVRQGGTKERFANPKPSAIKAMIDVVGATLHEDPLEPVFEG
ncbi:MAG: hypothetical protein AAGA06_12550 [Pseudomonadota bacterium]